MDRVENCLYETCLKFSELLEFSKEKGIISDYEYETHIRLKRLFIHEKSSKLSV